MAGSWEHFPHEADIGVRGSGATLAEAFEQGARALTAVITDPRHVRPRDCIVIECSAPDHELLFADWLNAIIFEMASRHMLFASFQATVNGDHLHARICGEKIDRQRHQPVVEIKGATYTQLRVIEEPGHCVAQCVVDV